jgi:hypothetical protein
MEKYLVGFLEMTRGAFSRKATFAWFVVVFAGLTVRTDWLGVTSIIRALDLSPTCYECLLHFFHASSWNGPDLLLRCVHWLKSRNLLVTRNGRIIINGDETKVPKEGRCMPLVGTIRQTSETSSKPSYFRGHEWAVLGVLIGVGNRIFCAPAWAELMEPGVDQSEEHRRTSGIVKAASQLALSLGRKAYLVLDAFYSVGTVFKPAIASEIIAVITRAKANCRAHILAKPTLGKRKRGRPRKYSGSVKVKDLHHSEEISFETRKAQVYGKTENVSIYALELFWKPAGALLLFVLAKTSRGPITLICSDLDLDPVDVLELYCSRSLIEVMFDRLKNLIGIMTYHFWSKSVKPQSRRPVKNDTKPNLPKSVERKKKAILNFVHIGLVLQLFLQAFACEFAEKVSQNADCYLRTPSKSIPSEFIAKVALRNILASFLCGSASNPIVTYIRNKKRRRSEKNPIKEAA